MRSGPLFYYGGVPGFAPAGAGAVVEARSADSRTNDARLHEVAEVYTAAQETGKPTEAVGHELFTSYSTAARLVMEARRRGFLPPAERRTRSKGQDQ